MFERRIILKHHLTDSRLSFIITLLREIWYHPPSLPALVGNNRVYRGVGYVSWLLLDRFPASLESEAGERTLSKVGFSVQRPILKKIPIAAAKMGT